MPRRCSRSRLGFSEPVRAYGAGLAHFALKSHRNLGQTRSLRSNPLPEDSRQRLVQARGVASAGRGGRGACPAPQICRPTGTRTRNPRIKSPLLCQLSYRPAQIIVVRGAPPSNRSECETRRPRRILRAQPRNCDQIALARTPLPGASVAP